MSASPIVSINDELLAELEAAASDSKLNIYRPLGWAHSVRCGNHLQTDFDFLSLASPETVLALLAHIVELKHQLVAAGITAENCEVFRRDAERIEWLAEQFKTCTVDMSGNHPYYPNSIKLRTLRGPTFRLAIDAAMDASK